MIKNCEILVIGGGHAGVEAAFAAAKKKHTTILLTQSRNQLASMPCNPSIGGPAKGIITREIDALGGMQAYFADKASIQIKMLNTSKGPAVRALRSQIDHEKYMKIVLQETEKQSNLEIFEDKASDFIYKGKKIVGVVTKNKNLIYAQMIIITTGTYLHANVLRGKEKRHSGPENKPASYSFANAIKKLGMQTQRLKTGTPPRIWTKSIDFSEVQKEILPLENYTFSSRSQSWLTEQIACWLTYTNQKTHDVINKNLQASSMYSGTVNGIGPRYCPSIEDKIVRFSDKPRHQLFFEPTTRKGDVIYLNGLSTSMPIQVQKEILQTIPGLKNCQVKDWAYAIEYDAIDAQQLDHTLASKEHRNIFFAGQINGTSGYEEAACQGLMAGINAALKIEQKPSLILQRHEAYIGVLIDDLIIRGTTEPYRMLTSRAEFRLLLRNDNADERLTHHGFKVGLISKEEYLNVKSKYQQITHKLQEIEKLYLSANSPLAKKYQAFNGNNFLQLICRPEVNPQDFLGDFKYFEELTIIAKLSGYIRKQKNQAERLLKREKMKIPKNLNYDAVPNLASEGRQKLKKINPLNIGQACRISGVNPTDIQMLIYFLQKKQLFQNEN